MDGFQGDLARVGDSINQVQAKLSSMITLDDLNKAKHEQIAKLDELMRMFNSQMYAMNEQSL
jgi:hypothetical protein